MIVAVIAYVLSGHRGIYPAQRLHLREEEAGFSGRRSRFAVSRLVPPKAQ